MKYIITETKYKYLRRLDTIDDLIKMSLREFGDYNSPKVNTQYMINFLTVDVTELYFFRENDDIYVDGDEYDELSHFIESYLNAAWRDKIQKYIDTKRGL